VFQPDGIQECVDGRGWGKGQCASYMGEGLGAAACTAAYCAMATAPPAPHLIPMDRLTSRYIGIYITNRIKKTAPWAMTMDRLSRATLKKEKNEREEIHCRRRAGGHGMADAGLRGRSAGGRGRQPDQRLYRACSGIPARASRYQGADELCGLRRGGGAGDPGRAHGYIRLGGS